jgi:hypothetical protein
MTKRDERRLGEDRRGAHAEAGVRALAVNTDAKMDLPQNV